MVYFKKNNLLENEIINKNPNKKINNFVLFFQKIAFYFFIFQLSLIIILFLIYKSSDFSKEHSISFLLEGINKKIIKYTNISLNQWTTSLF